MAKEAPEAWRDRAAGRPLPDGPSTTPGCPGYPRPAYPGFRHLAFQVDSVDEMLREMGADATVTQGSMDFDALIPGWCTVWVADPDGRIIEISQRSRDQDNPPPVKK